MERPRIKSWSLMKYSVDTPILAILYEDGNDLEVMHLLMKPYKPVAPEQAGSVWFGYVLPLVTACLIVGVLIQYARTQSDYTDVGKTGKNLEPVDDDSDSK